MTTETTTSDGETPQPGAETKAEKLHIHVRHPQQITIEGAHLFNEVSDNPEITPGKTDILTPHGLVPMNYNPATGEIVW